MKSTNFTIRMSEFGSDGYSIVEKVTMGTSLEGEHTNVGAFVKYSIMNAVDLRKFPVRETIERAVHLTEQLVSFWGNSRGWSPAEVTDLLSKSRLDRQASITKQLRLFGDDKNEESGYLILAWAALGSLTEGLLKLFLAVHYKTYQVHTLLDDIRRIVTERGIVTDPDGLMFEKLRQFFAKMVFPKDAREQWKANGEIDWLLWLEKIQSRRNAIHAFRDREIGSIADFHAELQNYLIFLRKITYGLPYPDRVYEPQEGCGGEPGYQAIELKSDSICVRGVIKWGKLMVGSQADGEFLKATLHLKEEISVVNPLSLHEFE